MSGRMNIVLNITKESAANQGQGETLEIQVKTDVTLFQARALAKRIKQLSNDLTVKLLTEEETIEIQELHA